jgi:hypothetical protein
MAINKLTVLRMAISTMMDPLSSKGTIAHFASAGMPGAVFDNFDESFKGQ